MSREWYIRTDTRNVEETFDEIDTAPRGWRERWKEHRKKYIFWMVEGLLVVVMLAILLPYLLRQDTPDYTLTLVTESPLTEEAEGVLTDALAVYGEDRDGDGKVEIAVRPLVPEQHATGRNSALEQFITSFTRDDYTFFAMQPDCYTRYLQNYVADGVSLFEAIPNGSDTYENLLTTDKTDKTPALLYGVRALPQARGKALEDQQAHLELLRKFAENRPAV